MTTVNVQFSDATEETVIGYASSAQPLIAWPYQGAIDTSDSRWATYYSSKDAQSQIGLPIPD
ncbi:hypothetical protein [Burkholderia vietnamiensis]|uniref:hypothetical protein n=1 Tax=Burkholderia vietnamiensis TaxID=60552 RepID=UPI00158EA92C|nr:hypothetical protein [Burkholderia vietnamiensis]